MFTKRQYIEYLIATTGNYTCANLAEHLDGEQAVSHDVITDYLRRDKLTPQVVAPCVVANTADEADFGTCLCRSYCLVRAFAASGEPVRVGRERLSRFWSPLDVNNDVDVCASDDDDPCRLALRHPAPLTDRRRSHCELRREDVPRSPRPVAQRSRSRP